MDKLWTETFPRTKLTHEVLDSQKGELQAFSGFAGTYFFLLWVHFVGTDNRKIFEADSAEVSAMDPGFELGVALHGEPNTRPVEAIAAIE